MIRKCFISLLVVASVGILYLRSAAQQPAPQISADQRARIETAVTAIMSRRGIPSLSIAVVVDNRIAFQQAYGVSDLENWVPAKMSTSYRIASVTKSLTAVAAMQLVERGKLDLDAPVQKYAPTFPVKQYPITTRQVLAHLSGVRHYKREEGEWTNRYENLTAALSIFKDDPLNHEPETRYTYTTFGYTLLGVIIEGASGMSYTDYLRENVLKPAGMNNTQVDDLFAIIPNRARGYRPQVYAVFDGKVRNAGLMDSSYKIPGGGLVSTADDMARFAIAVQSGALVKPETFALMTKMQKTRDGKDTGYGYGFYIYKDQGVEFGGAVGHGGVQQGFTSDLWMLPQKKFAVVSLTNLEGGGILGLSKLASDIADIVLK